MDLATVTVIPDPLDRAAAADALMWAEPSRFTDAREVRRQAVLQAVRVGRSREEVAARLRVQEADVDWMTRVPAEPVRVLRQGGSPD